MLRLLLSRLIQLPLIVLVIFAITFTLAWWIPGDPLQNPDGKRPPPEVAAAMQKQYNLHSPAAFAISYLKNAAKGDLGPSLQYKEYRVNDILADSLPVSVALGFLAIIIALFIGLLAGVVGALKPGSFLDFSSLAVALLGISLPTFVTGSLLLVLFGGIFHLVNVGSWGQLRDYLLPAITLAIVPAAYIARLTRLGLAQIMNSHYIRTARAKGVSDFGLVFKHALKVAFLPVLSFLGPATASAMTGSFVVEKIYNVPGLGEHFVNAVINKDQFLILGVVLVYAVMLVSFNMIVDLAYVWIDPRIDLT